MGRKKKEVIDVEQPKEETVIKPLTRLEIVRQRREKILKRYL